MIAHTVGSKPAGKPETSWLDGCPVPPALFDSRIRRLFFGLQEKWGGVPFEVVNDGEVTALAGSMALNRNQVLGLSMGTSTAGGYVMAVLEL